MAARTKSKVSPKYKTKYRVKNWLAYDYPGGCGQYAPRAGRPGRIGEFH